MLGISKETIVQFVLPNNSCEHCGSVSKLALCDECYEELKEGLSSKDAEEPLQEY